MLASPPRLAVLPMDSLPPHQRRAVVDDVLHAPAVASRLPGARFVDHPAVRYLAALVDGRTVGVFPLVRKTAQETDIHAALLPEALAHCRALGRLAVAAAFADATVQRLVALVRRDLGSAANYARRVGFTFQRFEPAAHGRAAAQRLVLERATWEART